jgi:hypothetical protein
LAVSKIILALVQSPSKGGVSYTLSGSKCFQPRMRDAAFVDAMIGVEGDAWRRVSL